MAVSYKDYYKLLGVERKASSEEITKAYRKLAKECHPDLHPGDKEAEEKFKDISEAYEVLKDSEKRKAYDTLGSDWQHGQQFSGFSGFSGMPGFEGFENLFNGQNSSGHSDFFDLLFGNIGGARNRKGNRSNFGPDPFNRTSYRPRRGQDINSELYLSLESVLQGGNQNVTIEINGKSKTLSVNIPAGIKEGAKLRLSGQGEVSAGGGENGDLFLKINYQQHPLFAVDGTNLIYEVNLAPWEAVLGCKLTVPTLESSVEMNIAPGASSGKKFRLRGKGLGSPQARGDILVKVAIKVPENLSDAERELWENLAKISTFKARNEN